MANISLALHCIDAFTKVYQCILRQRNMLFLKNKLTTKIDYEF